MAIEKILVVDDELLIRDFLAETLRRNHYEVLTAENGKKALKILKDETFDLVICDMKLPDITGLEVIQKVKELAPRTIVVIITAFGSIQNAVEAMRLGAFNYLVKPFSPEAIEAAIEKAKEHQALLEENAYLREQASGGDVANLQKVVFASPVMANIMQDVLKVANSNASVFISGESGTGKEVIAQAIHFNSMRKDKPFIRVNCAAVPETLIESEFFGHEKGSFTGAHAKRVGRFELANFGSLLLDEITEIPMDLQSKLLRVIQEHEFERVGGTKSVKVDVRLISTSNRDMKKAVSDKSFREDLYYRLNVVPIHLPPLRERPEDIIPLSEYFLEKFTVENHKKKLTLTEGAKKKLMQYSWPGNIRELANIIERTVVLIDGPKVEPSHIVLEQA